MRIIDSSHLGVPTPAPSGRPVESRVPGQGSEETKAAERDRVELSGLSGHLLESPAGSREERVRALQAAVQSGTYQVDSPALSRTLVDQALAAGKP